MPPKPFDLETELPKAIARLREMADEDGLAPMLRDYNKQRGAGCASTSFFESHGIAYTELVQRAGLQQRRSGPVPKPDAARRAPNVRAPDVPPDVEAEIQAAFARGDHHPLHYRDWPLFAIPTKVEQFTVPLPDGSGYRITRYYASIR
jgi:hypothetical protein